MMTIVSPSLTSRVKPARTRFAPKALWTSMSWIKRAEGLNQDAQATPDNSICTRPAAHPRHATGGRALALPPVRAANCRSCRRLRGEAAERAAHVAFAKALERAVAELPDALARDAEHRADLLERVLAPALQAEVQPEHLRVARRERVERLLDLVGEEAVHRLLLGVGHLVGDEALDQRAIALRVHRRVEPHVAGVQRGERLDDVDRQPGELRQLLGARLPAKLLPQDLRRLDDAREVRGPVERHANRPTLARERREDRLTDPPHRVRDELDALVGVELPRRGEQADVPLADQVDQREAAVLVLLRHRDHEAEVPLHELLERVGITRADAPRELDLFRPLEQGVRADLVEVLIENVPLGLARRDPRGGGASAAALLLDFSHVVGLERLPFAKG